MAQVTGRVFLKLDGELQRSKPGAKLMFGGRTRDTVEGDDSIHGYTEKLTAPTVEFTLSHTAQTSLARLADLTDTTVTFETDTGVTYVVRNAWTSEPPDLTGGQGEVSLKMAGLSSEELS
jgi:hypothetical protein